MRASRSSFGMAGCGAIGVSNFMRRGTRHRLGSKERTMRRAPGERHVERFIDLLLRGKP